MIKMDTARKDAAMGAVERQSFKTDFGVVYESRPVPALEFIADIVA